MRNERKVLNAERDGGGEAINADIIQKKVLNERWKSIHIMSAPKTDCFPCCLGKSRYV